MKIENVIDFFYSNQILEIVKFLYSNIMFPNMKLNILDPVHNILHEYVVPDLT